MSDTAGVRLLRTVSLNCEAEHGFTAFAEESMFGFVLSVCFLRSDMYAYIHLCVVCVPWRGLSARDAVLRAHNKRIWLACVVPKHMVG